MYIDYHLKLLLWCIFIFGIIGLAYVGAATTVKEGLEDQSTCNATCACFDKCGPGTYKLPSNTPCTGSSCTASDCCKPNPTCETIKACPSGRQFKSNYKQLQCEGEHCEENECCDPIPQPNCLNFTCQQNAALAPNYKEVVCAGDACTDTECCLPNPFPTCFGNNVKCPKNYYAKKDFQELQCSNYECETDECCLPNPTCGKFDCAEGSYLKSPSTICQGPECTQSECCTPNPKCSTFQCGEGYEQKQNAASITCHDKQCVDCECCTPITPKPAHCPTPNPSPPTDINVYYPGLTVVEFNENGKQKGNGGGNKPSPYHYWATPQRTAGVPQTTNMFAPPPTGYVPLGGEVYNQDPFLNSSSSCTNTHFGPTIMDPTFIRE